MSFHNALELGPPFLSPASTRNERDRVTRYWPLSNVTMQALVTVIRTCTCYCVFTVTCIIMASIGTQNKKHDLNMNEVQELLKLIRELCVNAAPVMPIGQPITRLKSLKHAVSNLKSIPDLENK